MYEHLILDISMIPCEIAPFSPKMIFRFRGLASKIVGFDDSLGIIATLNIHFIFSSHWLCVFAIFVVLTTPQKGVMIVILGNGLQNPQGMRPPEGSSAYAP